MIALPAERSGYTAPPELVASRKATAQAAASGQWRTNPAAREQVLGGVRVLRFSPPGRPRGTVLHFHGGGYRLGCPEMLGPFASLLAARCVVDVICPAYRLAPEFPYPAALHDGSRVMAALVGDSAGPLIISGDSAGGGLAASIAMLAVADGRTLTGLILLSAWLDLTLTNPDYETNAAADRLFSRASASQAAELYLQGVASSDPLASPLFANLRGCPGVFISAGAGEVLVGDSVRFHAALRAAGVPATLSIIAGMEHVAVTRGMNLTGAVETFEALTHFIRPLLASPSRISGSL